MVFVIVVDGVFASKTVPISPEGYGNIYAERWPSAAEPDFRICFSSSVQLRASFSLQSHLVSRPSGLYLYHILIVENILGLAFSYLSHFVLCCTLLL